MLGPEASVEDDDDQKSSESSSGSYESDKIITDKESEDVKEEEVVESEGKEIVSERKSQFGMKKNESEKNQRTLIPLEDEFSDLDVTRQAINLKRRKTSVF